MTSVAAALLAVTALVMTGCTAGGMSPELLQLLEVQEGEQKIVCFRTNVQSPVPGSATSADAGILALPTNIQLTSSELIAAMNACF